MVRFYGIRLGNSKCFFSKKKKGDVSFLSRVFFLRGGRGGRKDLVGTLSNFLILQELSSPG